MALFKTKKQFVHKHTIIVNSIPKAGTNLLLNTVTSIPNTVRKGDCSLAQRYYSPASKFEYITKQIKELKPGFVYSGHIPYFPQYDQWLTANKIKQVFIYRDPRAVVVSAFYFILEMRKERQLNYNLLKNGTSNEDKLLDLIYGIGKGKNELIADEENLAGIKHVFEGYRPWLKNENTLALKYEDIMKGGGEMTKKILTFLNFSDKFELDMAEDIYMRGANPSKSHTFRKGGSEEWKKEITGEREIAFRKVMPESLLNEYGYTL